MTTLIFLATLAVIFVAVMLGESAGDGDPGRQRPIGLLAWVTGGNWPAKIGGLLLLVGVGALLRYALLHVDVPASAKLAGGVVLAVLLGFLSTIVPDGPSRRAVSLALGGAAFGVAYLTAYSAFALFGYLSNPMGLGLLGLASVAAAAYAVQRSALSMALLSMVGAFLAPAFAVGDPGPRVVYGYYVGAGLLTLAMVMLRGWRPLIHLSFLFTLAGSVFFAWTSRYFEGPYANDMLVFIVVLAALHVAMPLLEKRSTRLPWVENLDSFYLVALPVVAVVLSYFVAVDLPSLSMEIFLLAGVWALAATVLAFVRQEGVAAHAVIAGLLAALATALRFRDLPWELLLLTLSVAALVATAWLRRPLDRLHGTLAGSVVLFGALHMLDAVATGASGPAFANGAFVERCFGALLLIVAGAACRRIRQSLDTLLLAMGILWAALAIGVELVRIELATVGLVVHWALLLLAASLWIPGRKLHIADRNVGVLAIGIVLTAAWAAAGEPGPAVACASLAASALALIGLAIRPLVIERDAGGARGLAALFAPAAACIWAFAATGAMGVDLAQPALASGALTAIAVLLAGRAMPGPRGDWLERIIEVLAFGFFLVLAAATLIDIARNAWAVVLEILCLAGLVTITWIRTSRQQSTELTTIACVLGVALILQANLLRWLGPPGRLDVTDVLDIGWPAVISLLWVSVASLLTVWARRSASRSLWIAGAVLLVVSAVKLLVYDFGSLGDLANILAVIAAGGIFLLVGWLAPIPPAEAKPAMAPPTRPARPSASPPEGTAAATGARTMATESDPAPRGTRTLAIVIAVAVGVFLFHDVLEGPALNLLSGRSRSGHLQQTPVEPARDGGDAPSPNEPPTIEREGEDGADGEASEPGLEARVYEIEPPEPEPPPYQAPPTRDAAGVPTYTQYSYPQATQPVDRFGSGDPPPQPAPREAGIDQLIREGRIRPATRQDVDAWIAATGADRSALHLDNMDYQSGNRYVFKTYVVQREMTFPAGLHGAHSATFIVPRGVPRPFGDPGHSRVLDTP